MNNINYILFGLGAWYIFDGIVSMTIFASNVDSAKKGTIQWYEDQAVRIVRIIGGIALIILGFFV